MDELPELYIARYMAKGVLSSEELVPVRVSYRPPIVPLAYPLEETARTLLPEFWMLYDWPYLSQSYSQMLDSIGPERIAGELAGISARRGGKALALCDYDDLVKGDRSPRIVFAAWWEQQTGKPVYELTNDGQELHYSELHKRVQPQEPKDPTSDRRWRPEEPLPWPLNQDQVSEWLAGRYWQQARSKTNPHSYTVRAWGDPTNFELIVLHIREYGSQELFGGDQYTYLIVGNHKYWSMGDPLATTVVLNRKRLGQDEGYEAGIQATQPGLLPVGRKEGR